MQPLSEVGSASGAPMGRENDILNPAYPVVFEVERLKWVDGVYDCGGAYWGRADADYIFRAEGESDQGVESVFVRAKDLSGAQAQIQALYPAASFSPFCDLDTFAASYAETAMWSSTNDRYEQNPLNETEMLNDSDYSLSSVTEAAMRQDCSSFLEENSDLIARALAVDGYSIEKAGRDFWLTRNRHGAGFWDRGLGDVGKNLSDAAHAYGGVDLYVGDDDQVHASGEEAAAPAAPGPR